MMTTSMTGKNSAERKRSWWLRHLPYCVALQEKTFLYRASGAAWKETSSYSAQLSVITYNNGSFRLQHVISGCHSTDSFTAQQNTSSCAVVEISHKYPRFSSLLILTDTKQFNSGCCPCMYFFFFHLFTATFWICGQTSRKLR